MHKVNLLTALLISLALLCASAALAQTYTDIVGSGFTGWPSNSWVPIPSLDEGRDQTSQTGIPANQNPPIPARGPAPWTDFVGTGASDYSRAAYYQFDTEYLYFRMRVDAPLSMAEINNKTFGDQFYIFIDYPGYPSPPSVEIPGCPDYAISWDVQNNLQLSTVTGPTTGGNKDKWLWNEYGTPSDIGEGSYLRMVTGDGYLADLGDLATWPGSKEEDLVGKLEADAWIDWAIRWDSLGDIDYGDTFSINYGSARYPLTAEPKNSYWDIAAGEVAEENEFYYDDGDVNWSPGITTPEPASMALTLVAVGLAGGIARRRKARNEAGREE